MQWPTAEPKIKRRNHVKLLSSWSWGSSVKKRGQLQHCGFRQNIHSSIPDGGAYTLHAGDEIRAQPPIFIRSQKRLCLGYLGGGGGEEGGVPV